MVTYSYRKLSISASNMIINSNTPTLALNCFLQLKGSCNTTPPRLIIELKGHSQLCNCADLDTSFSQHKSSARNLPHFSQCFA